jgi:hypothetical protein
MSVSDRYMLSTVTLMSAVFLVGILQGLERPRSVYSIMPQWWHLMELQYVAAIFHLPSVSTANIKIMQYTKSYSNVQYQKAQPLWYPRCCFLSSTSWQPLYVARAICSLMSVEPCQQIQSHILYSALHMVISCPPVQCVKILKYNITFYFLSAYWFYILHSTNIWE